VITPLLRAQFDPWLARASVRRLFEAEARWGAVGFIIAPDAEVGRAARRDSARVFCARLL